MWYFFHLEALNLIHEFGWIGIHYTKIMSVMCVFNVSHSTITTLQPSKITLNTSQYSSVCKPDIKCLFFCYFIKVILSEWMKKETLV